MPPRAMGDARPLTVFYDGACPLCDREISFYKRRRGAEGVRWIVMKEPITMSAGQIAALKEAIGFDNNRPVQPLNGRVIFE